jgi:hypothetical protein
MRTGDAKDRKGARAESFGVLATALFASVGVAILGFVQLRQRQRRLGFVWLLLWLGFFLPLLGVSLASGHPTGLVFVATLLPTCLLASFALQIRPTSAATGLIGALIVLWIAFVTDYVASAYVWQQPGFQEIGDSFEQLVTRELPTSGTRAWAVPPETTALRLELEARVTSGQFGWGWHTNKPAVGLERIGNGESAFTRAAFPITEDPYLMRTYNLGESSAGKTFRAVVTLRSQSPVKRSPTRGIWLDVWGPGGGLSVLPVSLDNSWQTFTHQWTAPDTAADPIIRLILNDFNGHNIEIREAVLEEFRNGSWHQLVPLSPTAAEIELNWPGRPRASHSSVQFPSDDQWQKYVLDLEGETLSNARMVTAKLVVDPGLSVEVRNLTLSGTAQSGQHPYPVPHRQRRSLWFGHPNNAGHVTLAVGLAALLAVSSGWQGFVAVLLALTGIAFTGSRTAWLAGAVGLPWLLWLACRPRERVWVFGALAAAGGLAFAFVGLDQLGRLRVVGIENTLSRPEIWRAAWQALIEHPWTGIGPGPDSFNAYFASAYGGVPPEFVPNAHNLWLIFASEYGVFGLAAVLWLTLGLVSLAWQWGHWRGIAFVLPLLALNLYDYSLFTWWILFMVILGFNQLKGDQLVSAEGEKPRHQTRASNT